MKVFKIHLFSESVIGVVVLLLAATTSAQVISKGLPPATNSQRSFVDASIARDSDLVQSLDLLRDFYPAIEVTVAEHDNVRRRTDVEEADRLITAKPSLAYRTNFGRHKFYAAYTGVFTYHETLSQEDAQSNSVDARLGLDLSRRWDLNIFASTGEFFEERGISGSRPFNQLVQGVDEGPDEIETYSYGADIIYGRKTSPLVGVLGYDKYVSNYQNNNQGEVNPSGSRDRESDSLHLDLSYRIGSRTSVFGRIQYTEIDYQRSFNSLDSEQTDYLLGFRWKPTSTFNGVVGVGHSEKDFIDPDRSDYSNDSYYANLGYSLSPFSGIQLSAARTVEEPGDLQSDFYESDLLGIGFDHAFTSDVSFNAYVKWIDDDYDTGRTDEFFDFGLGLDYSWRSWLDIGLYYGEIERTSTLDNVEYKDRYFGLRLRSDLRSLLLEGRRSADVGESFEYPERSNR